MSDLETKSAEVLAREIKEEFNKKFDAVKEIAEKALATTEGLSKSEKEKADEALLEMNKAKARLDELEQKLARAPASHEAEKSIGQRFAESDGIKSFLSQKSSDTKFAMHIKGDITTADTGATGNVGAAIVPNYLPGIQKMPERKLVIRDLISPGHTNSPLIPFTRETGFTNNASIVPEGSKKPYSDITYKQEKAITVTIAHLMRVSLQALSDVAQLQSQIDEKLIYGLKLAEEQQLLNGDGTGNNMLGIIPQATKYAEPAGLKTPATVTGIDVLRIAMLQASLAEYPATGHVLNPIDWTSIELLKDNEGRYIIGTPQGTLAPTLWGLPVVTTQSIQVGKFLTGAFKMGAQVFDQWDSRIQAGYNGDDFSENMVSIRAEERLALAVYRPEAFIYGTVTAAAGGSN